jgi:hypothetical protein
LNNMGNVDSRIELILFREKMHLLSPSLYLYVSDESIGREWNRVHYERKKVIENGTQVLCNRKSHIEMRK